MRRLAIGLVSAVFAPTAFAGDTDAVVMAKEVVVYSAPGDTAPDTGTLPKGTRLMVHHEEPGGWLAVQPPNGSISWVNHRFLDFGDAVPTKFPAAATIRCGDAGIEIEAGKFTTAGPLNVRRTKLPPDTAVTVMGPRVTWAGDNSFWYPIWSQAGDFRYVKKDGVQSAAQPPDRMVVLSSGTMDQNPLASATVRPIDPLPSPGVPTVGDTFKSTKPADWPNHPLWIQAEAANKAGDLDKAERLYFQLAGEMSKSGGDADLGNLCYSRIHSIRERRRSMGGDAVAVRSTTATSSSSDSTQPVSAHTTAQPKEAKDAWYGPGMLIAAIGKYQGQPVYSLETEPGRVIAYVVPAAGFDLLPHVRKKVALMGKVIETNYSSNAPLVSVSTAEATK